MTRTREPDWQPRSDHVQADQIASYDAMRERCPVAYDGHDSWTVFRHADTVAIVDDTGTYSNRVSRHLQIPNGFDGDPHRGYRRIIDRYFTRERLAEFEPTLREVCARLVAGLPRGVDVEAMSTLAEPFANDATCAFMGWPDSLRGPLRAWTDKNRRATFEEDREAMAAIAVEFDGHIRRQLDARRGVPATDPTGHLLAEAVDGRALSDDELVSIIRNWTVGELSTIAASAGVVAGFLAGNQDVQTRLRTDPTLLDAATDEIQRINSPFVASRRRVTTPTRVAGTDLAEGDRVYVVWASANRDPRVFDDPDEFRLDRDQGANLVYGRGVHYCPGAPLARLELRVLFEELFAATTTVRPGGGETVTAHYPTGGFERLSLRFS
ncbi:cytochrome P450 [Rhodococcus sp. NPDC058514]|uniref:cytochrome P450 n=1 Tax=unclassified Rhodococcus (in: high G+C Gram-positive bacteria) TaxID=192944 RepID=UPI0036507BC4